MFTAPDTHIACMYKLSQAKTYRKTFIPIKYKQPLPTNPLPKVQLYTVVKCETIQNGGVLAGCIVRMGGEWMNRTGG